MKIPAILLATVAQTTVAQTTLSYTLDYTTGPTTVTQTTADNYQTPAYGTGIKIPLKCWHCDAMSFEECANKGQEETCLVSFQKKILYIL